MLTTFHDYRNIHRSLRAERLYLSEGTVRNAISSILDKLGLRDRTQLAIFYWQHKGA